MVIVDEWQDLLTAHITQPRSSALLVHLKSALVLRLYRQLAAEDFGEAHAATPCWYRYFWKPVKVRRMSSAFPRSATASEIELWYFRRSNGVSLS